MKFLYETRRVWPLLVVIVASVIIFGAPVQLGLAVHWFSMVALGVILIHLVRKALFPTFDLSAFASKALERPNSAAAAFLGMLTFIAFLLWLLILGVKPAGAEQVPARAVAHLPVLSAALDAHWPAAPLRHILAGQVEKESSWRETATLKTSRELGRGLVQPTIAYRADGSERFNAYREAVQQYRELAAWDWQDEPFHVQYQLTYLVLRDRKDWTAMRRFMVDDEQAWRAALVCYNAGPGRVTQRRAQARLVGLPVDRWTNGLELAHTAAEERELYGRPLWVAVNEYPRKIFQISRKYQGRV